MKWKCAGIMIGLMAAASSLVVASDAVEPATLTFTNVRDEAVANASDISFYEGTTLLLTNCVILSGTTTNSDAQGLSDVAIELKVGNTLTNTTYTGTVQVEAAGTWYCTITVPTNSGSCYLQLKITDVNTNSYIYPWKLLNRKSAM